MAQEDPTSQAAPGDLATFGCGTFLPGRGPFNFPDYPQGGGAVIDSPFSGGNAGPQDPVGGEAPRPPYPGEPKEGGPHIGPGGPGGTGTITWPPPGGGWTIGCPDAGACGGAVGDGCSEDNPADTTCCEYAGCPDPNDPNWVEGAIGCGCYAGDTGCCSDDWVFGCPDAAGGACNPVAGADGCTEGMPGSTNCCEYAGCPDPTANDYAGPQAGGCACIADNTDCCNYDWNFGCPDEAACNWIEGAAGCIENEVGSTNCCLYLGCGDPEADNYEGDDMWGCDCDDPQGTWNPCCDYPSQDPEFRWGDQSPTHNGDVINLDATIAILSDTDPPSLPNYVNLLPDVWDLGDLNPGNIIFVPESWTGVTDSCYSWYVAYFGSCCESFDLVTTYVQEGPQGGKIRFANFHENSPAGQGFGFPDTGFGDPCMGLRGTCCLPTSIRFRIDWNNPFNGHQSFFFVDVALSFVDYGAGGLTTGGDDSTGSTLSFPKFLKRAGQAILPKKKKEQSIKDITTKAIKDSKIDLNDPDIQASILNDKPTGLMDSEIAYLRTPKSAKIIENKTGSSDLFGPRIDENIAYIVENTEFRNNWNSEKSAGVGVNALFKSLTPEVILSLRKIKNYDGSPLTNSQIFSMIGSRILDGTLGNINTLQIKNLEKSSNSLGDDFEIIPSNSDLVNESAALGYIERHFFSLDPEKSEGDMRWILPNWKIFATDVEKHIEIKLRARAGGEEKLSKFYIKDDNTLVGRSNLMLQDGDYVDVRVGGQLKRYYCKSEIDHAFIIPEQIRQKVVKLLGGNPHRTLSVSADASSGIEFDYSLSTPRQNFYVMSAILSSTVTEPISQGSYLLKDTTLTYDLVETSSVSGLETLNEYIRYKANSRTFIIDDDDRILDYIEQTGRLQVKQTDILVDAPKTIKTTPLLTRQIPWYIIIYPTNRTEYNIFNGKSTVDTYNSSGAVTRRLKTTSTLALDFNKENLNKFAPIKLTGVKYTDVYGNYNTQTRITEINADATEYKTGYRKNNIEVGSAQEVAPTRNKTTFRIIKEIITELNNNYILDWNSLGRTLTTFDVMSRLSLKEFSKFTTLENYSLLFPLIKNGLVQDVKVFEPTAFTGSRLNKTKTQLIQQKIKKSSQADTFPVIKAITSGYLITPPETPTTGPKFSAVSPKLLPS